jgi:hypothetical protein
MILNLFSVPIWIGNIDAAKINIQETVIEKQFGSGVPSTHGGENKIDNHSLQYLYQIICKLIEKSLLTDFEIKLENIWTNYYKDGDFQESHAHAGSELCFIIYKKIQESNTVFKNPNNIILGSYFIGKPFISHLFGGYDFQPQCRENQIIVFPAFLEHYVKKTSNAETIAGNMTIITK